MVQIGVFLIAAALLLALCLWVIRRGVGKQGLRRSAVFDDSRPLNIRLLDASNALSNRKL